MGCHSMDSALRFSNISARDMARDCFRVREKSIATDCTP